MVIIDRVINSNWSKVFTKISVTIPSVKIQKTNIRESLQDKDAWLNELIDEQTFKFMKFDE